MEASCWSAHDALLRYGPRGEETHRDLAPHYHSNEDVARSQWKVSVDGRDHWQFFIMVRFMEHQDLVAAGRQAGG